MTAGYALLDSGDGRKLEMFGVHLVDRPAPTAIWPRSLDDGEWSRAEGVYQRSAKGGGSWQADSRLPESWKMQLAGLHLTIRPTGFGHMGVFPEQERNWARLRHWAAAAQAARDAPLEVLNLFAYTGASTIAAALGGARVCHVDAAGGIVSWARDNAAQSGVPADRVRWIVEDVVRFVEREIRRQRHYDAIILDPPSYGRGKKGEVWMLERDLAPFLERLALLLSPQPAFCLLSAHTPGVGPLALENLMTLLAGRVEPEATEIITPGLESGAPPAVDGRLWREEMHIHGTKRPLPSGAQATWTSSWLATAIEDAPPGPDAADDTASQSDL